MCGFDRLVAIIHYFIMSAVTVNSSLYIILNQYKMNAFCLQKDMLTDLHVYNLIMKEDMTLILCVKAFQHYQPQKAKFPQ